jgi:hypothetical protein
MAGCGGCAKNKKKVSSPMNNEYANYRNSVLSKFMKSGKKQTQSKG